MKNQVGKRIQQARKLFGLTQAELAYRMGISSQSISAFESGRIVPEFKYLEKIAQFTHQPLYFFTGEKAAEALAKVEAILKEVSDLKEILQQIVEAEKEPPKP